MTRSSHSVSIGSPVLCCVPTELERARLEDCGGFPLGFALHVVSGFGVVASAALAARAIAQLRPSQVLLLGIAGTFDESRARTGSACEFSAVAIDGIGVGEGEHLIAPPALGFPQWPARGESAPIFDQLELAAPRGVDALLLTTCAASRDASHAALRRRRFPSALAEDMEGFAVAFACELAGVPLRVMRGISNVVGDRESSRWRIPAALAAVRELALREFESAERTELGR